MAKNYKIAVIGGDGTGPEVVAEGLKVLKAASIKFGFSYDTTMFDYGGERYLKTGKTITDDELEGLKKFDAIFLLVLHRIRYRREYAASYHREVRILLCH